MPFDERGLNALSTAAGFTLWHYRTGDTRAAVIAPGYFSGAGGRLAIGDVLIVQAADATALLPVNAAATAGSGVTLDTMGIGLRLLRSATQPVTVVQSGGSITARAIIVGALPPSALPDTTVTLTIIGIGPIARVAVTLIDALGQPSAAAQVLDLVGGTASLTITLPGPPGAQWRLRVADNDDPGLVTISAATIIRAPGRLLLESGPSLLQENGAGLLLQ